MSRLTASLILGISIISMGSKIDNGVISEPNHNKCVLDHVFCSINLLRYLVSVCCLIHGMPWEHVRKGEYILSGGWGRGNTSLAVSTLRLKPKGSMKLQLNNVN
jgi:hypothetical protein